jgi:hypothetical protein
LQKHGWRSGVRRYCRNDPELHHLARGFLISRIKVIWWLTAAKGLVWSNVAEHVIADRNVGKVDDHVGSLGQSHQQTAAVISGEVYRRRKETTLVSNLPHFNSGDVAEVQNQESRLATVQKA